MTELTPAQKRLRTMKEKYGPNWASDFSKQNVAKIKAEFGEDFFERAGRKGGSALVPKGFARMNHQKQQDASRKGGLTSKRTS